MHGQDAKSECLRLPSARLCFSVLTVITWRGMVEGVLKFAVKKSYTNFLLKRKFVLLQRDSKRASE